MGFSGRLVGPFKYSAGYGYIATDNKTTNKGISHNYVNTGLQYRQKKWFGDFSMVYVGPAWTNASTTNYCPTSNPSCFVVADYTRLDVNGGYSFRWFEKQTMTLTAFERNLTNNNYATMIKTGAYRDPGRQYGIELAAKFF